MQREIVKGNENKLTTSMPSSFDTGIITGMMFSLALPLLYSAVFFWSFLSVVDAALFSVGVVSGMNILLIDRLLHAFYLYPEYEFSTLLQGEWRKKNWKGILHLLGQAEPFQEQLMTRSVLFLLCYVFLAIFVLTSTGSIIGIGVILGMGLRYVLDFWRLSKVPEQFARQFLWQVKRQFTPQEIRGIVVVSTALFLVITLLVLF